ncbi:MAG: 2-dehydropantoate 2-reductase [Myxococcales bacterium]|nr:2-dehydropantoate 2-reductase [Myxococcales bacterium]
MKPTTTIHPELLDNLDEFRDPFYRRFEPRTAPKPLQLDEKIAKDYLFPTFYGDVTCAIAIFMCSYEKAERMMPHPRIKPVRMPRGRALVAFSCYEYKKVLGVAPYNEIAMTIPVMVDPLVNVPVLPMVADKLFEEFGYYVFSMPVTSLENQLRGVRIWGLPKVVQEIDIREEGRDCVTTAFEEDGTPYFELRVPMDGEPTEFDVTSNLYSRLGDELLQSETSFKGRFNVTKYMQLLVQKDQKPERPVLTIHDTPSGRVLEELEIEEHPFQFRFSKPMTSCFDLPNAAFQAPFRFDRPSPEEPRFQKLVRRVQGVIDPSKRPLKSQKKILFFGTGVIGGTVGAWLAPHYSRLQFFDRPEVAKNLNESGLTTYCLDQPDVRERVDIEVKSELEQAFIPDVIVLGVKNYSLEPVAKMLREAYGDAPLIVAMQNGVENQRVLPRYFSKVVYCVVGYNAWADEPGVYGYQKKGPLVFGTLEPTLDDELQEVAAIFNLGVETHVAEKIQDAAHCKIVINLTNSLTTLIGLGVREISDRGLFQKLLTNMLYEGVQIIKAAGYNESRIGGMPSWLTIWAGANLPAILLKPIFEKNVKKMVISSMAQDIILRGSTDSELETLNGYLLGLADKHNVPAPYNHAIYELCKKRFAQGGFEPMDIRDVWSAVAPRVS